MANIALMICDNNPADSFTVLGIKSALERIMMNGKCDMRVESCVVLEKD